MKTIITIWVVVLGALYGQQILAPIFQAAPAGVTLTNLGGCTTTSGASRATNCTSSGAGNAGDLVIAGSVITNTSGTGSVVFSSSQCSFWQPLDTPSNNGTSQAMEAAAAGCILTGTQTPNVVATWTGTTGTSPSLNVQVIHSSVGWGAVLLDRYISSVNASAATCPTGTTNATRNPHTVNFAFAFTTSSDTYTPPAGYTQQGTNSTHGIISTLINSTAGTQSASTGLITSHACTGIMASVQLGSAYDCSIGSCAWVQGTDSSGQTANFDHITLSAAKNGDSLIYCQTHNEYTGTGTVAMSDNTGYTTWYPFNSSTGGLTLNISDNVTMTSTGGGAGNYGMYCFWTPSFAGLNGTASASITGQPTATDCSTSCSYVGGVFFEWSGLFTLDQFNQSAAGATSASGSNNAACTSMTTTANNDFIVNFVNAGTSVPTITAGTSPITFTIPTIASNVNGQEEYALWSSSGAINPHITLGTASIGYGDICLAFK